MFSDINDLYRSASYLQEKIRKYVQRLIPPPTITYPSIHPLHPEQDLPTRDGLARQARIDDTCRLQVLHEVEDQAVAAFGSCKTPSCISFRGALVSGILLDEADWTGIWRWRLLTQDVDGDGEEFGVEGYG